MSKLILGVGFNSGGKHKATIDGKRAKSYTTWHHMLQRAYCSKLHVKRPTYVGCSVSEEWLDFQHFSDWFYGNPYSDLGYHLDKDLLVTNNKVYGPETCCFVPQELNTLLLDSGVARGDLPQGVYLYKPSSKFMARVGVDGKREYLGLFDTETEAHQVYKTYKEAHVKRKALEWQDRIASDVFDALMRWSLDS